MTRARKLRAAALAALTAACLVAAPAQAFQASVAEDEDGQTGLFIDGTPGADFVNVAPINFDADFQLTGSDPTAGAGCTKTFGLVTCPGAGVDYVQVDLGDGEDGVNFANRTPDRVINVWTGNAKDEINVGNQLGTYYVDSGPGDDLIEAVPEHTKGVEFDGGDGKDIVIGGSGNDSLTAGPGDDLVRGRGGNDDIALGDGADKTDGGAGFDQIDGGAGDDIIGAGADDDIVIGGPGQDRVGSDHVVVQFVWTFNLESPAGNDEVFLKDGEHDVLVCGGGGDVVHADTVDELAQSGPEACERIDRPLPPPPPPPPPAPLVVDGSPALQRLASALRGGVAASVRTNGPGRVRLQLLDRRGRVLGSVTRTVTSATTVNSRVRLNAAGRRMLRYARRATLTVRCTFSATQGGSATSSRNIVLRR